MLGELVGPGRGQVAGRRMGIWDFCPLPAAHSTPSLPEVPETVQLEVRTRTASGLLLWQGMVSVGIWPGILVFPALWWPGQWERERQRPQPSEAIAVQAGDPRDPVLPCRRWERPAKGRTSSVSDFRMGTLSSGRSPPFPGPLHPLGGFLSGQPHGSSHKKPQLPASP